MVVMLVCISFRIPIRLSSNTHQTTCSSIHTMYRSPMQFTPKHSFIRLTICCNWFAPLRHHSKWNEQMEILLLFILSNCGQWTHLVDCTNNSQASVFVERKNKNPNRLSSCSLRPLSAKRTRNWCGKISVHRKEKTFNFHKMFYQMKNLNENENDPWFPVIRIATKERRTTFPSLYGLHYTCYTIFEVDCKVCSCNETVSLFFHCFRT